MINGSSNTKHSTLTDASNSWNLTFFTSFVFRATGDFLETLEVQQDTSRLFAHWGMNNSESESCTLQRNTLSILQVFNGHNKKCSIHTSTQHTLLVYVRQTNITQFTENLILKSLFRYYKHEVQRNNWIFAEANYTCAVCIHMKLCFCFSLRTGTYLVEFAFILLYTRNKPFQFWLPISCYGHSTNAIVIAITYGGNCLTIELFSI